MEWFPLEDAAKFKMWWAWSIGCNVCFIIISTIKSIILLHIVGNKKQQNKPANESSERNDDMFPFAFEANGHCATEAAQDSNESDKHNFMGKRKQIFMKWIFE